MRLDLDFYKNNAKDMAPMLLGKLLCRNINGQVIKLRITETECYYTEQDTACHAHKGKTERTKIMYEQGGLAYVYLCYGIHNLLNVVSGDKDVPQAVLIRGIEGYDGPAKLTKFLQITRDLNGENLINSNELWFEDHGFIAEYKTTKRIGIDYATPEYRDIHWRFIVK